MKILISVILVGTLSLVSCNDDESIDTVASSLSLKVTETCYNNDEVSVIRLEILTVEHYSCANYNLITQTSVIDNILLVEVLGIDIGNICLTAFGPASASIILDEEIQKIIVIKNDITDEYSVSIDESIVKISPKILNLSSVESSEFQRPCKN